MLLLVLSIVALAAGPLLAAVASRRPWAVELADGFVVVAVGGLVVLHVIPSSIEMSGSWALVAALVGLVTPLVFERFELGISTRPRGAVVGGLVLAGVLVHAILDGAAMTEAGHASAARALAVSVVVHRIPVGLAIWWLVRPSRGLAAALVLLAIEGGGGALGFFFGGHLLEGPLAPHLSLFQAALAGALLHVLAHHAPSPAANGDERGHHAHAHPHDEHEHVHGHDEDHEHGHDRPRRARFAAGIGGLIAIGFVALVTRNHPIAHPAQDELGAQAAFLALANATAWPLLAACLIAGVAHVILPENMPDWLSRREGARGALRGLAVGTLLPVCSCGLVPLHRTLGDERLAPSAAAGVLVASPELGPAALLLSFTLLGTTLALARICTAAAAAVVIAFLLTYVARVPSPANVRPGSDDEHDHHHEHPHERERAPRARASIAHGARFGFVEMLDHTAPWLVAGLLAAALAEPTLPHDAFVGISPFVAIPVAALLGVPFYVSASAAMPVLAVLLHKGLSPGSAVAFLLTGPAVTPKTISFLAKRFGPSAARMFAGGAALVAIGCGLALDALAANATSLSLHRAAPLVDRVALPFLALLVTASLLRQGPRAMLGKLLAGG